jgi:hypothetical protein
MWLGCFPVMGRDRRGEFAVASEEIAVESFDGLARDERADGGQTSAWKSKE